MNERNEGNGRNEGNATNEANASHESAAVTQFQQTIRAGMLFVAVLLTVPFWLPFFGFFRDYYAIALGTGPGGTPAYSPGTSSDSVVGQKDALDFAPLPDKKPLDTSEDFLRDCRFIVSFKGGGLARRHVYIRTRTFEHFTRTGMDTQLGATADVGTDNFAFAPTPPLAPGDPNLYEISFLKNYEPLLPHLSRFRKTSYSGQYALCADGAIRLATVIPAGTQILSGFEAPPSWRDIRDFAKKPRQSPFLDFDEYNSPELRALEGTITPPSSSPRDILETLQRYFQEHFTYSRNQGVSPGGDLPLRTFLLRTKCGYCQHIAGAMVLILRMKGIPARVGSGYYSDTADEKRQTFYFNSTTGHAWAEVLTDSGWVIFDIAIPSEQQAEKEPKPLPIPDAKEAEKLVAGLLASAPATPPLPSQEWYDSKEQLRQDNPRLPTAPQDPTPVVEPPPTAKTRLIWSLVIAFLIAMVSDFLLRRFFRRFLKRFLDWWKKRRARGTADRPSGQAEIQTTAAALQQNRALELDAADVIASWNRFVQHLTEVSSISHRETETATEFVGRICLEIQVDPGPFAVIASTFSRALYGEKRIDGATSRAYIAALQQLLGKIDRSAAHTASSGDRTEPHKRNP
jgi:hypothetical protein